MSAHEPSVGLLRIVDAAANRAGEGLRVVEDYLRFALDDRHLTELCKGLRHDLTAALSGVSPSQLHAARETRQDVGADLTTDGERRRADLSAVVAANFRRLLQALRTLEEYAKILDPAIGAKIESLRYRAYTLEKGIDRARTNVGRLAHVRLVALFDGGPTAEAFGGLVDALVAAGVHAIQLRDKTLADRELLGRARLLRQRTAGASTLFIVNDRPDLAALSHADGVHVGQEDLSVKDARTIVGPDRLVGVSTHSIQQARQAVLDGADYIGVGPIFASRTKSFGDFPGLDLCRAVGAEIRLPAFAIGGITRDNVADVLATGIRRVAVAGAVTQSADPAQSTGELLRCLGPMD